MNYIHNNSRSFALFSFMFSGVACSHQWLS